MPWSLSKGVEFSHVGKEQIVVRIKLEWCLKSKSKILNRNDTKEMAIRGMKEILYEANLSLVETGGCFFKSR